VRLRVLRDFDTFPLSKEVRLDDLDERVHPVAQLVAWTLEVGSFYFVWPSCPELAGVRIRPCHPWLTPQIASELKNRIHAHKVPHPQTTLITEPSHPLCE